MKKSNLYTRTGDNGSTSLVGGARARKDSARLEAYGTIDELNSWIGAVAATPTAAAAPAELTIPALFRFIGAKIFDIGGYLATDPDSQFAAMTANAVSADDIARLENAIDQVDSRLPALNSFVLPGGTPDAATAHIARTVCRRAERRVITLASEAEVDPAVVRFLNRLSDLLFAIARFFVIFSGTNEIFWSKDC